MSINTTVQRSPFAQIQLKVHFKMFKIKTVLAFSTIYLFVSCASEPKVYMKSVIESLQIDVSQQNVVVENKQKFKVICHYVAWSFSAKVGIGKCTPEDIDPKLCTHIIYNNHKLNESLLMQEVDQRVAIEQKLLERTIALKLKSPDIKILLSTSGDSDLVTRLISNETARSIFIDFTVKYLRSHGFDGLQINWHDPKIDCVDSWVNCSNTISQYMKFFEEISKKLRENALYLSVYVFVEDDIIGSNISELEKYIDWFLLLQYHYNPGGKTYNRLPLFDHPNQQIRYVDSAVRQ